MSIEENIPLPVVIEYTRLHLPLEYQKIKSMKDPGDSTQIIIPEEHMDQLFKFNLKMKLRAKIEFMKQLRAKRL